MTPRESATAELLYFIDRFLPGSNNRTIYETRLDAMSDGEFDVYMTKLESGDDVVSLFAPNLSENKLNIQRNFEIARELGHDFFQYLYLTDAQTGQVVKTPVKHLMVVLPLRRQAQMLYSKISVPDHNQAIDERSGQPTGPSKGASISYPELQINAAKGLDNMVLELIKYRGGDTKAFNAMNRSILETGGASLDAINTQSDGAVKATQTLDVMLKAMHINSNLKR